MPDEYDAPGVEGEREQSGHELELEEHKRLERSVVEMALSRIEGVDGLFVGGLWALRRSDSLLERGVTHALSLVSFDPSGLKNFKNEPFSEYGKPFKHLLIDVDDVEDEDLLIHMPQAVAFIEEALTGQPREGAATKQGAIFVHCAAGKSRSVSMVVAYLLWKYPARFGPDSSSLSTSTALAATSRKETGPHAVNAAVELIRRTRPMAEPNEGFMQQLALWWEWKCPQDMEAHPAYQRWAYQREVKESVHLGMVPSRLRFEDEVARPADGAAASPSAGTNLRCKKCRRTLATGPFVLPHTPAASTTNPSMPQHAPAQATPTAAACQHVFIEPLSWMRPELEKGEMSGRLSCPNARCGAGVGRYDWKGFRCSCGAWLTPAFSLQRAKIDEEAPRPAAAAATPGGAPNMGIRMPPGFPRGGGNL
ncbi:Tyrosine-protein phosphatase YVH1 [Escovopsis weberi]|uniref:protein-tyrosine-phosphatase n=1 Tax=Escovopsis weberi TaxID=150374 RepID=A0A0N0RTL3_ESCWE|nr:Tyrosine-protein phosphatase YVH1 [Escovopsis weberi]